jgi:hypothetical protein
MMFDPELVREIDLKGGECNTSREVILQNVEANIRRGLPQARPYQPNPNRALLVCGGPSLVQTEKELAREKWRGGQIIAVNGAYQWCIDHNLMPSAFVMLDARSFNARFCAEAVEGCHYLLASQCHPWAFDQCADRTTTVWHALTGEEEEQAILEKYYFGKYNAVTLGTTVGVRAISLMRMLGFTTFTIFGLDSCWLDGEHHAYAQPENNGRNISVWLRPQGRDDRAQRFLCSPWQVKQAQDFMLLTRERGEMFDLDVRGPGLIAAMLRTGAELQIED